MKKLLLCVLLSVLLTSCSNNESKGNSTTDPWRELKESNDGNVVWDTLTEEQQELVDYPELNLYEVYFVKNGKSYHSIKECYTLSKSKNIQSKTLEEAQNTGLNPCSKCVGD